MRTPLVVDLDGTLIHTDMLHESALKVLRDHPLSTLLIPLWLLRGKAVLKEQLASRLKFDASALPDLPPLPTPPKLPTVCEDRSKSSVNAVLKKATKDTADAEYQKIKHGAKLLAVIDPKKVRQQCPACDRLFKVLATAMETTI